MLADWNFQLTENKPDFPKNFQLTESFPIFLLYFQYAENSRSTSS